MQIVDYSLMQSFAAILPSGAQVQNLSRSNPHLRMRSCCDCKPPTLCSPDPCYLVDLDVQPNRITLQVLPLGRQTNNSGFSLLLQDYRNSFDLTFKNFEKAPTMVLTMRTTQNNIKLVSLGSEFWKGKGKSLAMPANLRYAADQSKIFVKAFRSGLLTKTHLYDLLATVGNSAKPPAVDPAT